MLTLKNKNYRFILKVWQNKSNNLNKLILSLTYKLRK